MRDKEKHHVSLRSLVEALKEPVEIHGDLDVTVKGLCCDSRKVKKGEIFVALPGSHLDGRFFISDAVYHGACAVVCEPPVEKDFRVPVIIVKDAHKAVACLASRFFGDPCKSLTLIGVTGTNGKTTTTLLLESILSKAGYRVASLGTLAYRWGGRQYSAPFTTPEPIRFHELLHKIVEDRITHVVMEVSSHAVSLHRIEGCKFQIGVFTNLSRDHLDFHGSLAKYFDAKRRFFTDYLDDAGSSGPTAAINLDDEYGRKLKSILGNRAWSYSLRADDADVYVPHADFGAWGIYARLVTPCGNISLRSRLLGSLNLYNIVAATSAALALGISKKAIVQGVGAVTRVTGRLERVPNDRGYEVIVDYAHTPDAMEKALRCLRDLFPGRLWLVFGCGGDRDRGKRPLMGKIAARYSDIVIVTSDNPRTEKPESIVDDILPGLHEEGMKPLNDVKNPLGRGYFVEVDRKLAIELALGGAQKGDIVLIAGKGHENYQIVGDHFIPFSDRKMVESFFGRSESLYGMDG